MKSSPHSFIKCLAAAMILSSPLTAMVTAAVAQVTFSAPPVSAPGNRESGSARSDTCAMTLDENGLTAVLPETNVGLTTKAFPSFFAYVPANNAERAEFRLFDEATGNEVFAGEVTLPLAESGSAYRYEPSIISVSAPSDGTAVVLEPGKRYVWAMMLICNSQNRAEDIVVTGVVQRPDTDYFDSLSSIVRERLSTVDAISPAEQLTAYGEAGIWQDLLETLATLTNSDPSTYRRDWNTLLDDQGLGAIANSPIVFREVEPFAETSVR